MFQKGVEIGSGVRPKIGRTRFPPLQFRDTGQKYDRLIFFFRFIKHLTGLVVSYSVKNHFHLTAGNKLYVSTASMVSPNDSKKPKVEVLT